MNGIATALIGKVLSQEIDTVRIRPAGKTDELLKEIIFGDGLAYYLWSLDVENHAEHEEGEMPLFIELEEFPAETVPAQIAVNEQESELLQAFRDIQPQWSEVQFWQNVIYWGTSKLAFRLKLEETRRSTVQSAGFKAG